MSELPRKLQLKVYGNKQDEDNNMTPTTPQNSSDDYEILCPEKHCTGADGQTETDPEDANIEDFGMTHMIEFEPTVPKGQTETDELVAILAELMHSTLADRYPGAVEKRKAKAKEALRRYSHLQTEQVLERLREQGAALTVPDKKGNHVPWWPDGFKKCIEAELERLRKAQSGE